MRGLLSKPCEAYLVLIISNYRAFLASSSNAQTRCEPYNHTIVALINRFLRVITSTRYKIPCISQPTKCKFRGTDAKREIHSTMEVNSRQEVQTDKEKLKNTIRIQFHFCYLLPCSLHLLQTITKFLILCASQICLLTLCNCCTLYSCQSRSGMH